MSALALGNGCVVPIVRRESGLRVKCIVSKPQLVPEVKDWLTWQFENWARWMRGDALPEGLPVKASGGMHPYLIEAGDSEVSYEKLDLWSAEATNAAIEGLESLAERAAIQHRYLHAVYRFPRGNYPMVLLDARAKVRESLVKRGVWLGEG